MHDYTVLCYSLYLALSVSLTIWVARTLHRNGRVFLVEAFHGDEKLADSVNHLLVVGFYLINIGWVSIALRTGRKPDQIAEVFELLSYKVGVVLLLLGVMHFLNIYVFSKMRKNAIYEKAQMPVAPDELLVLD